MSSTKLYNSKYAIEKHYHNTQSKQTSTTKQCMHFKLTNKQSTMHVHVLQFNP